MRLPHRIRGAKRSRTASPLGDARPQPPITVLPSPRTTRLAAAATAIIATLAACAGGEKAPAADTAATTTMAPAPAAAVQILSPAEGDTISLPFTVTFGATGVEVVAANGTREEGKGHHHLIIDGDAPMSDSLPLAASPVVIHIGTGASETVIDSLSSGPHRMIAVFASGDHVPWSNVARDTVNFVVR